MDLNRLPFNCDNFNKLKNEVAELRDLVLKLNAKVTLGTDKEVIVSPPEKGGKEESVEAPKPRRGRKKKEQ